MSASGQYACLVLSNALGAYYSSNYGQSWTVSSGATNMYNVCMSASGQYVIGVAATAGTNFIYYSTNYGVNWIQSSYSTSGLWYGCAMSANGQYLLAVHGSTVAVQSITPFPPQSIISQTITSQRTVTTTPLNILAPSLTTGQNVGIILGQNVSNNNYATIGFQYVGNGLTTNYIGIGITSPTTLCIAGSGNVGIGITNPYSLLHITGSSTGTISLLIANTNTAVNSTASLNFSLWATSGSGTGLSSPAAQINAICRDAGAGNTDLSFSTYTGNLIAPTTYTLIERMRITAGGNVGIGTNGPYSQLSLHTAFTGSGLFPASGITWSTTNGTPWQLGSITGYVAAGSGGSTASLPGGLAFATKAADNSYSSSLTTQMVLDAGGNVGIGTTIPGAKLHIHSANNCITASWNTARANGNNFITAGIDSYFITRDGFQNLGAFIRLLEFFNLFYFI
jgi:hypothetical protein